MANTRPKRTARTILKLTAVLLGLLILAYGGFALYNRTPDPTKWSVFAEQGEKQNIENNPTGGGLKIKTLSLSNMSILAEQPDQEQLEAGYYLTATVKPANADNTRVTVKTNFVNPESAWAKGKNVEEYIRISTPENNYAEKQDIKYVESTGVTTVYVECLKAFGEQILITVETVENPEINATCVCDYVKRVTMLDVSIQSDGLKFNSDNLVTYTPIYSDGTLQGEYSTKDYGFKLDEDFKQAVTQNVAKKLLTVDPMYGTGPKPTTFNPESTNRAQQQRIIEINLEKNTFRFSGETYYTTFASCTIFGKEYFDDLRSDYQILINKAFAETVREYEGTQAHFIVQYMYLYNGINIADTSADVGIKFNADSLRVYVNDVTLTKDQLIF